MHIEINIQERWHIGSGFGDGPGADALVIKTAEGLPYLPGKTFKGLLRDACKLVESLGFLEKGETYRLFGNPNKNTNSPIKRFETTEGCLDVRSALLGNSQKEQARWINWARENKTKTSHLFDTIHSTAIAENGIAKESSLRLFEFTIPMKLYTEVSGTKEDLEKIKLALPLIRELGVRRYRGFGRCSVSVVKM